MSARHRAQLGSWLLSPIAFLGLCLTGNGEWVLDLLFFCNFLERVAVLDFPPQDFFFTLLNLLLSLGKLVTFTVLVFPFLGILCLQIDSSLSKLTFSI